MWLLNIIKKNFWFSFTSINLLLNYYDSGLGFILTPTGVEVGVQKNKCAFNVDVMVKNSILSTFIIYLAMESVR